MSGLWKAFLNLLGFTPRLSDYPTCRTCGKPSDLYTSDCTDPIHLHGPARSR
jgi:hypothetical protein